MCISDLIAGTSWLAILHWILGTWIEVKIHCMPAVCTGWFIYFWYTFLNACHVQMTSQDFLIFCALSFNYIGYESDGNDMKATGGVVTFVH